MLVRNSNILQLDFAMPMRRIVIAKHRKHSQNLNPRRVERQEDHALLSMARGIRIGLSHENADRASRIAYARRPPFAAVDLIMVAVTNDGGFDLGGVRGCDSRLGHQKDRANLTLHQRPEPALLMLARSIAVQVLHADGSERGAVDNRGRPYGATHPSPPDA